MEMRATKGIRKKHMQRSAWKWVGLILMGLAVIACGDEGVGDPCTPETVPSKVVNGMSVAGFEKTESYIESNSVQCRSRLCIVHRLDNGRDSASDPRKDCGLARYAADPTCVRADQLEKSVHCTCKCGGPKTSEQCKCPSGFKCREILTLGGDGIRGNYCVKPEAATAL
jgi:hypothetical protein